MAILNLYNIFTIFIFTVCVNGTSVCMNADIGSIWDCIKYCSLNLLETNPKNLPWISDKLIRFQLDDSYKQKSNTGRRIHDNKYVKTL